MLAVALFGMGQPEGRRLSVQSALPSGGPLGNWTEHVLPTDSGIGVYKQTVQLSAEEASQQAVLDLGKVDVATEVFVNGEFVGTRLAPHYSIPDKKLHRGSKASAIFPEAE